MGREPLPLTFGKLLPRRMLNRRVAPLEKQVHSLPKGELFQFPLSIPPPYAKKHKYADREKQSFSLKPFFMVQTHAGNK
jgi:hypothetical protein